MDKVTQIMALKRIQDELDEMTQRIDGIIKDNEVKIADNVDAICSRIEQELEEIYELTDERVYQTRHLYFHAGGFQYGLAFDGTQNRMYFLDYESACGVKDDNLDYHIVIAKFQDASGIHYYEDGKWRDQRTKEIIAAEWDTIKEELKDKIVRAYERQQKETVKESARKLRESETRLASVTKGE